MCNEGSDTVSILSAGNRLVRRTVHRGLDRPFAVAITQRQNQFGFTAGGPVVIPKLFNGRNKVFFFGDYEGFRRVQGTVLTGSVPSVAERSSGYTNFQDLIAAQSGTLTDALGRTMPMGTILDPATTRQISPGVYVRDPFGTCGSGPPGLPLRLLVAT